MVDQKLVEYIRKSQDIGKSWDTIKQDLANVGWNQEDILAAYDAVNIPLPPPQTTPNQDIKQEVKKEEKPVHKSMVYTSIYSGFLGVVLTVSLLILSQNAVNDLMKRFAPLESEIERDFYYSQEYKDYEAEYDRYDLELRTLRNAVPQKPYTTQKPVEPYSVAGGCTRSNVPVSGYTYCEGGLYCLNPSFCQIWQQSLAKYQSDLAVYNQYESKISEYNTAQSKYNTAYEDFRDKTDQLKQDYLNKYKSAHKPVSISTSLIFKTIIILPLWVITFLLFSFLKEQHKKFEPLLMPYYLVSGWLLIYLFFSIAYYVYRTDTVLGVYVGFGLLAVILTGAILGLQKYRRSTSIQN